MNLMVFNFLSIVHYSITLPHRRVMLLCAGILGRYYTDYHSVDEDMMSISVCSGYCKFESFAGVTYRSINDAPTNSGDDAASRCRHPKLIKYYTDWHDVDEESMTISLHGGEWLAGSWTGVTYRFVTTISDVYDSYGSVASSTVEILILYGWT